MAFSTINKSSLYQSNLLYTGNNTGQSITGVGFQPDFIWNKARTNTETHNIWDVVRGTGKGLVSSSAGVEQSWSTGVTSFDSDGWTMGALDSMNDGSVTYASWNWKAGGTAITGSGSLTNTRSTNTTAGFSIIKYSSTSTANSTIAHGLNSAPDCVLIKRLGASANWILWSTGLGATTNYLYLNETAGKATSTDWIGVDATNITLKTTWGELNTTGDYVCYAWKNIQGYSKVGSSYFGNGLADGSFIYTGHKSSFVMVKKISSTGSWWFRGNKIAPYNTRSQVFTANSDGAETSGVGQMDFLSNGFKLRDTTDASNASGSEYIYFSFGQPIISNSGVVATAR